MAPVLALNAIPAGIAGLISQLVTLPPLLAGVVGVIAVPLVNVNELGE